ncbi:hypothetical protein AVEN_83051-1 [Araneus ventricosus]|uniref:Uncharacterized protein n=1 Tax=Araneus ventricosus TaxID=182803 RepID=A0A4Y2ANZ6_ARAVE|nr:hypothetical protein AVEN_83051-1 [Araneus ventricosus]
MKDEVELDKNIKIKDVRKLQHYGLAVNCPSEVDIEKILEKIGNKPFLQEQIKPVQIKQQLSKCIVYGLEPETTKKEIEKALDLNISDLGDKYFKVLSPSKGEQERHTESSKPHCQSVTSLRSGKNY